MSTFNLAISCLTTPSLSWFMDLTFQVPMQHCSLQQQTPLSPSGTSTTAHHFHFGRATSFFLELLVIALHSFPVVYWTPSNLGGLIFWCHMFLCFLTVYRVLDTKEWFAIPCPLQWTMFCQNSSLWPIHLQWPCTAWLIVSLIYVSPLNYLSLL